MHVVIELEVKPEKRGEGLPTKGSLFLNGKFIWTFDTMDYAHEARENLHKAMQFMDLAWSKMI